jgi:hypothetical protein
MMGKYAPLKIWLKNREHPIEVLASKDCIMGFTDFVNGTSNLYHMEFYEPRQEKMAIDPAITSSSI